MKTNDFDRIQDLSEFKLPRNFRGRPAIYVQLWWLIQCTIFRLSPQFAYGFRRFLLRLFGASIGKNVLIRPTAKVTYPWKVSIGENTWIGDDAVIYSLGEVTIGSNTCISQLSYICAGDHDYTLRDFPIRSRTVMIGNEVWIAAGVFIAPGVSIGNGTVIGAVSSVFSDMPEKSLCYGSPCKVIRARISNASQQ